MKDSRLICVDCYDKLEKVEVSSLTLFYCDNVKCRRFGVLTMGGLSGEKCEKSLVIDKEEGGTRAGE